MFAKLLPRSAPFFEYFKQQNAIMCKMAELLGGVISSTPDAEEKLKEMTRLEEDADALRLTIIQELSQTFITPIDREDVYAICTGQERVIDSLHGLGARFFLFSFVHLRFPAQKVVLDMADMARGIGALLDCLSAHSEPGTPMTFLHDLKEDCEMLLMVGMGELQDQEIGSHDQTKQLIGWTQLYERIEQSMRLMSDLGDTLEQAVLKYA